MLGDTGEKTPLLQEKEKKPRYRPGLKDFLKRGASRNFRVLKEP